MAPRRADEPMSDTIVRVWGREGEQPHTLDAAAVVTHGASKTIALPVDHPLSKRLLEIAYDEEKTVPFLTVDADDGRWAAPLHHWNVRRDDTGALRVLESRWTPHPMWTCPELPA